MHTLKIGKAEFNVDAVKKMSKAEFTKAHKGIGEKCQLNLDEAYDKIKAAKAPKGEKK